MFNVVKICSSHRILSALLRRVFCFLMNSRPRRSILFHYTTRFRSSSCILFFLSEWFIQTCHEFAHRYHYDVLVKLGSIAVTIFRLLPDPRMAAQPCPDWHGPRDETAVITEPALSIKRPTEVGWNIPKEAGREIGRANV